MKELPIVYVERELLRTNYNGITSPVGYLVSQAYLKSENTTNTKYDNVIKNYEVEFIGYDKANDQLTKNTDYFLETGDYTKKSQIFQDYASCKDHVTMKNERLFEDYTQGKVTADKLEQAQKHNRVMELLSQLENTYLNQDPTNDDVMENN